jgi:hypothetical protein
VETAEQLETQVPVLSANFFEAQEVHKVALMLQVLQEVLHKAQTFIELLVVA